MAIQQMMLLVALVPAPGPAPGVDLAAQLERAYGEQKDARKREAEALEQSDSNLAAELRRTAMGLWASSAELLDRVGREASPDTPGWRSQRATRAIEASQVMLEAERIRASLSAAEPSCPLYALKARDEFIRPAFRSVGADPGGYDLRIMQGILDRKIGDLCTESGDHRGSGVEASLSPRARLAVLGSSAAASAMFGIAAGLLYGQIRTSGPLHRQILAEARGLAGYDPYSPNLCKDEWLESPGLEHLCERHRTLRAATIASAVLSGILLVTAGVVGVVHGCSHWTGGCGPKRRRVRLGADLAFGRALVLIGGQF